MVQWFLSLSTNLQFTTLEDAFVAWRLVMKLWTSERRSPKIIWVGLGNFCKDKCHLQEYDRAAISLASIAIMEVIVLQTGLTPWNNLLFQHAIAQEPATRDCRAILVWCPARMYFSHQTLRQRNAHSRRFIVHVPDKSNSASDHREPKRTTGDPVCLCSREIDCTSKISSIPK